MTDTQVMAALEPTQADRTATADLLDELSSLLDHVGIGQVADLIRDGEYDEHDAVQAFARHRLASSPAAEPVAWMYERTWEDYTPSREVRVQQWSTTEGRYAGWTETPLYAALATPPDGDAEVRKGLEIAQGIVESDLIDAKEHADADWIGQSQAALDAITTLLATPPSVPAQQGEGASLNCGVPYHVCREYSRIPAIVSPDGNLTNFHRTDDGLLGDRVTAADCSHFIIHEMTVIPATPPSQDQKGDSE